MGISLKQRFTSNLDEEHKLLFAHLYDLAGQSEKYGCAQYSDFLSENSQAELMRRKDCLAQNFTLFGGYEDAERKIAAFAPADKNVQMPLSAVVIRSSRLNGLTHRDFLGSIMSLGIKREKIGDIIIAQDKCSVIICSQIADTVARGIETVGRIGVNTSVEKISDIELPMRTFKEIKGTVASLRLDAVLAMLIGTGRGNTGEWIRSGRVFVDGICASKGDMHLSGGETISVRGVGKALLCVGGTSKKDRTFITLNKYM